MARTRTRQRTKQRSGFKLPTQAKIKSLLRKRSKVFLIGCIMWMFGKITKGDKIRLLVKIEKGRIKRITKRRKSKTRKATRRKRSTKRRSKPRKKTKAQIKRMRLRNLAKARRAKKAKRR